MEKILNLFKYEKDFDRKGDVGSTISPDDFLVTDSVIEDVRSGKFQLKTRNESGNVLQEHAEKYGTLFLGGKL